VKAPDTLSPFHSLWWENRRSTTLRIFCTILVAAILANGSYFWLQKSQLVPSSTYLEYRQKLELAYANNAMEGPKLELAGMYAVPQAWIVTKLLKDFFIVGFAFVSLLWLRHAGPRISIELLVPALFAASVAAALVQSMYLHGAWVALAGLRPIAYVAAGFLGLWACDDRSFALLCRFLVFVLAVELVLAFYEYAFGIPLFSTARLGNRVNGTFSFPSILGVFAVVVCMLSLSFSRISSIGLWALVAVFVFLTGSATALILSVVAFGMWAVSMVPDRWKQAVRLTALGVLFLIALSLPQMVARYDVLDSLWGRIEFATDYWAHRPPAAQVVFGKGLGIGSNVVTSALAQSTSLSKPSVDLFHARTDSTPLALVNQTGIVGMLLFYLMLGVAAWKDHRAAPVYAILFLAGLTINLLEFFPVNFLMGLLFCRSYFGGTAGQKPAPGGLGGV